ncbi:MAG: hypothetical protein RLQ25_00030 [Alphaproteobacteria bacterium]|uniref:hypothetical protein n=1 Tax=Marinobacter salarius TaxID=1420917 RepID=UPI0032EFEEF7
MEAPFEDDEHEPSFRFYDNRQKYLMFVTTCSEKWEISRHVGRELKKIQPRPPALRIFDAGVGDGTVLANVLRHAHRLFPTVPILTVGKEISMEDVRLALEKLPDRLAEHPQSVFVLTNMTYGEAPQLCPDGGHHQVNWIDVALEGASTHEFEAQIQTLETRLGHGWAVESGGSGLLRYVRPSVITVYRADQAFALDTVIPRFGDAPGPFDLIITSQPYRARASVAFKTRAILAPLVKALATGGRLVAIQSRGGDPGAELIGRIWPDRILFPHDRHAILNSLKVELGSETRYFRFSAFSDRQSLFRYDLHMLPSEVGGRVGTSTLFAAWNAATYVAQIEDSLIEGAMHRPDIMDITRDVLRRYEGMWFLDESFVVVRR